MSYKLIGKNFTPPDLEAKVTGAARYSEDFRADGMAFIRILASPMPHAQVEGIDLSKAEQVPGFLAALTPDEVKQPEPPGQPILSAEPGYVGQPIVAIAAETEQAAEDAIAAVELELEPLPFCIDPLESLKPGGPNALLGGNISGRGIDYQEVKWTGRDFALAGDDRLPMGDPVVEWAFGDIESAFSEAAVVVETGQWHDLE